MSQAASTASNGGDQVSNAATSGNASNLWLILGALAAVVAVVFLFKRRPIKKI